MHACERCALLPGACIHACSDYFSTSNVHQNQIDLNSLNPSRWLPVPGTARPLSLTLGGVPVHRGKEGPARSEPSDMARHSNQSKSLDLDTR